jgi:hypothetical protein
MPPKHALVRDAEDLTIRDGDEHADFEDDLMSEASPGGNRRSRSSKKVDEDPASPIEGSGAKLVSASKKDAGFFSGSHMSLRQALTKQKSLIPEKNRPKPLIYPSGRSGLSVRPTKLKKHFADWADLLAKTNMPDPKVLILPGGSVIDMTTEIPKGYLPGLSQEDLQMW